MVGGDHPPIQTSVESVAAQATRRRLRTSTSIRLVRDFRLRCAGKAFDPFLVITVECTGMLAPEFLKEPRALLRFFGQHMAAIGCRSDDPAVVRARSGNVAIDCCRPCQPAEGFALRHD